MTRAATSRRRFDVTAALLWRLAPAALALGFGVAFLLAGPRPGDLAVHAFRAELFGREGFSIWNGQWYGGHHALAYSVLSPPLSWLLGPRLVLVMSAVAVAVLFERLAAAHFGPHAARVGALWLGIGSATLLATARLPFALGVAFGLGAALALQRQRRAAAIVLSLLAPLASPVAGLFLTLAGLACAIGARERALRRIGAAVALASLAPTLLLSLAFPEGGYAPFPFSAYLTIPIFCVASVMLLPPEQRVLRVGAALYALTATVAVAFRTPLGGTAPRLGMLFGGPLLACAVASSPPRLPRRLWVPAAVVGIALLGYWQWTSAARDLDKALHDPAARADYFAPLVAFLETLPDTVRIEVPFTSSRWENAEIAAVMPLARGWQRQLDTDRNAVFYEGRLNPVSYASWLAENAVRYVALPSAKPDKSSYGERALIERGLPYLRLRWRSDDWRVYEFTLRAPFVVPDGDARMSLEQLGPDRLLLRVRRPGAALVRVRWSPYWFARDGCVQPRGRWTRVTARREGFLLLAMRFAPERLVDRGKRCDDG